jgi:hypothetical protein
MWLILACFVSFKTFVILYLAYGPMGTSEKDHGQQRGA